ncbi:MAG: hypothetical protein ACE5HB_00290, partial [Terriglobia bacterium]
MYRRREFRIQKQDSAQPGGPQARDEASTPARPVGEDASEYFLELIIDTLERMEPASQGAFLQKFLASLAGVEV